MSEMIDSIDCGEDDIEAEEGVGGELQTERIKYTRSHIEDKRDHV